MSEHVVLKNVKRDLKLATSSPIKAGMDKVAVDANHLKWLIEQAEQTESFKQLHKNYLDRYVESVGEINELKEEIEKLRNELAEVRNKEINIEITVDGKLIASEHNSKFEEISKSIAQKEINMEKRRDRIAKMMNGYGGIGR